MTTLAQRSFAGGEVAPAMYARTDQVKYATGLRTLLNAMVMRHGGVTNTPGTIFVGEVKDSSKTVLQMPFIFNSDQTYNLEFGDQYMRVIRNGAYVTDLTLTITAVSAANPGVVTYTGTDPVSGEEVYISGILGALGDYLNGRNFKIANVDGAANTFELKYMDGTSVNTTAMGAYVSGGTAARIYTITTPYLEADLPKLRFAQSADIITITSSAYAPRELARTGHAAWTLTSVTFAPTQAGPTAIAYSSLAAGAVMQRYQVTAVATETGEESLVGTYAAVAITGATQANPGQITAVGHGFATGDEVLIDGVLGMTQLNGVTFTITSTGANTFTIGVNTSAYTAYVSGGSARRTGAVAAAPTAADPHTISWTAAAGAQEYNIYKALNGIYGFIGVAGGTTFNDVGAAPDTEDTPPSARNPFSAAGDYPVAVTYAQQRAVYGGTDNDPETGQCSRVAKFKNFTVSSPLQDDDAVTFVLAGREVNAIKHLLEITGKLTVFTSGGEILIQGNADGVIKPGSPNPKQYTYNGTGDLRPIVAGGNGIYVQARGSAVRDAIFDEINGLKSNDLSIFSSHLLDGYTIVDWTYQKIPHSIVWAVRSDGVLLGFTYIREHELVGWHRHEFDGEVENVCAIPEGDEDALYLVIKRTINGATKRYIERMATRQITDIVDAVFVDCGLTYDGRNTGVTTMTLTTAAGWTYQDTLTLTKSGAVYFTADDVGNAIHLELDGELVRCEITGYSTGNIVSVRPHRTVPVSMRAVAISEWGKAVDVLGGLWHIEGKDISILADGFVAASPNNASYTVKTVANGQVTLDERAVVVHAGLPKTADVETLDPDVSQGETMMDKKKSMGKITITAEKTRGLFFGPKPPESSERYDADAPDPLLGLDELKIRGASGESYDDPVALLTGTATVIIRSNWNNNGRVFLRQVDPLPFSVLAIAPAGNIPIRG